MSLTPEKKLSSGIDPETGNFIKPPEKQGPKEEEIKQTIENLRKLKAEFPQFYPQTIKEIKMLASGSKEVDNSVREEYMGWQAEDFIKVLTALGEYNKEEIEEMKRANLAKLETEKNQPPAEFAQNILSKMLSYADEPEPAELDKLIKIISQDEKIKQDVFDYLNKQGREIDSESAESWQAYLLRRLNEIKE